MQCINKNKKNKMTTFYILRKIQGNLFCNEFIAKGRGVPRPTANLNEIKHFTSVWSAVMYAKRFSLFNYKPYRICHE